VLAAGLAVAGCVREQQRPDTVDPVLANAVLTSAAAQVQRCYRSPRIARAGKQIVTRVVVRLNTDGTLAELPVVVGQTGITPQNRVYAERMASAASLAIIRCAPLRLPPEHYAQVWQTFELKFSPRAAA